MRRHLIAGVAVVGLLLPACADPPNTTSGGSTPTTGAIDHPTDPAELVFRFGYEGGFTPVEYQLTNIPAFSLYGDGTIVMPGPQIEIYPAPALPSLEATRVSEDGVQAILEGALDAGLGTAQDMIDMGSVAIADAPEAVFTLRAGGHDRTVRVYALSELGDQSPPGMTSDEFEARNRLQAFVEDLFAMEGLVPPGAVQGGPVPFEASGSRVFVGPYRGSDLKQPPARWPLQTPLTSFDSGASSFDYACEVVTGADWSDLLKPAAIEANQLTPWRSQGQDFSVLFRPLLPEETGC